MKFLKSLSVCAMALASMFVFAGCNSGTLVENPSDELKLALDTAVSAMSTTTTDYKATGIKTYDVSSDSYTMTASISAEVILSGSGADFKAYSKGVQSGHQYSDYSSYVMSSNCEYYVEPVAELYALYETRSQTTMTTSSLDSALSKVSLSDNQAELIGFTFKSFAGEDGYSASEYSIYSLGTDSYRVDIEIIEGSLDSASIAYEKMNINLYVTDGKVVQIKTADVSKSRHTINDAWETTTATCDICFSYDNIAVTIPNTTGYVTVSSSDFPQVDLF